MKSIREKAEELVEKSIELSREESIVYLQGIEAGANYVLEQITEAIRLCDNDRNTNLYSALWDCIDELRK